MGSYVTLGSLLALTEQFRREFDVQTAIVNVELYGHKGINGETGQDLTFDLCGSSSVWKNLVQNQH